MKLGLSFRIFLYRYRVSLDVLAFIILNVLIIMNNMDLPVESGPMNITDRRIIRLSLYIIPSIILFVSSRLLIKDRRFYDSDTWYFFIPAFFGGIISGIILGINIHPAIGVINSIIVFIVLIILSSIGSLYDTEWVF